MSKFNNGQSFVDGDTVTGAKLNNITGLLDIYTGLISEQTAMVATVSTADQLLIADTDNGDSGAANRVTIQKLLNDTLTNGTYTNANLSGTITSNRTVSTSATITTGTIPNLTSSTANITLGTIPTLTAGTTTSTAANITNGTVQTLTASTATITGGTYSGTLNSTTGTIATLNSTTGTIATLNSTTGTIATLNSTTGTITNLSTTLAGDFTISQGTGTIGTAKVTPTNLSQPMTSGVAVASTSGTAIDFTGIPSWAKRITVMIDRVSCSGVAELMFRVGSGSIDITNYNSGAVSVSVLTSNTTNGGGANFTSGIYSGGYSSTAASTVYGHVIFTNITGNTWVASGVLYATSVLRVINFAGGVNLSGALDRVRVATSNGTDTFDGGTINIMYEG